MRKLTYTSADGLSVDISNTAPFILTGLSGFEAAQNNVYTTKSVNQDGATATGSSLDMAERTITGLMRADTLDGLEDRRRTLSRVFNPKYNGTLRYTCGEIDKICSCKVNKPTFGEIGINTQVFDIVLLCPNPFWQDIEESIQEIALWIGAFEFPKPDGLEIPAAQEKTGQSVTFTGLSEGDKFDVLTAYAETIETGTGTKSPDNPYTLAGTHEVTISDGNGNSQVYETPEELWSVPNGVRSEYNFTTGSGTKRAYKYIIDGSETFTLYSGGGGSTCLRAYFLTSNGKKNTGINITSNKFRAKSLSIDEEGIFGGLGSTYGSIFVSILKSRLVTPDISGLKTWFASNNTEVIYELATPTTITGTAQGISCYVPSTTVSVDIGEVYAEAGGGIEMGYRSPSLIVNVNNPGDVPCGMKIVFSALGEVENPYLLNVNTQEYFKIAKTMVAGETITVTTGFGNKRVVDVLNGVTSTILSIDLESTFLQLETGDNLYRYYADDGIDMLECKIYYSPQYLGV